ncbi:MAG: methyltransferase domain-containing protein [Planctomycetota bacterium]|jgi:SAM-dependent methyltransferase|nr:methyltransferase domain-containing protein [Blastopirellula sp.]
MSLDPVSPAVNAVFHAPVVVPLVNAGLPTDGNPAVSIESHAGARFFCEQIASRNGLVPKPWNILIAGCGAGHEAVAIAQQLQARVEAVDVEDFVGSELKGSSPVHFQVASVCELPFNAATFDAIFYHHVIEHVDRPAASLAELHRVLRPGGWLFVGTPNRQRLVSSIGAHQQSEWEATWMNKLGDNLRDWKDRMTGRFRNELGAHAGFSRGELDQMLSSHFPERDWVTDEYLRFKYGTSKVQKLLPLVTHPAVQWFAAPAIYVFARKQSLA